MTLHRSKDHVEPPSGPFSHLVISGRTLIACQNCASAKTGCDKRVPCSRCLEKSLQCIPRFARRASKAARRAAAQAASSFSTDSLLTSAVENGSENVLLQSPIQHLHGGPDQYDDHFRDAFINPLSPLSGYSATATSLSSSSHSDVNAFEHGQSSPRRVGFSEFIRKMDFIDDNVTTSLANNFRCCPENIDSNSNKPTPFPEIHPFKELNNYGGFTNIPQHIDKDTASFQGGFYSPLLSASSTLNPLYFSEVPNLHLARIWIPRLKRKRLFDGHSPNIHPNKSMQLHQPLNLDSQHSSHDRLAYNWVKLDQELSLFNDVEQILSLSDLARPLPDPKLPWQSKTIIQATCSYMVGGTYTDINTENPPSFEPRQSLQQLFQDLVHGTLSDRLHPRHLQILLHPLQALTCHSRNLLSWAKSTCSVTFSATAASSLLETERLLRSWYNLATEPHSEEDDACGLILYHFISLNLAADLVEIERLTSPETPDIDLWQHFLQNQQCFRSRQDAIFHCGQALRHLRAVGVDAAARPWWWPTAIQRAILALWAASHLAPIIDPCPDISEASSAFAMEYLWQQSSCMDMPPETTKMPSPELCIVAIDGAAPEDACFRDANWSETYIPVLTRLDEGVVVLTDAMGILEYGISLINAFPASPEGDVVVSMLKGLGQAWEGK
ncbi:hypothetical protein ACQKWADRAFT_325213 [Trichoderma austrokoningii]